MDLWAFSWRLPNFTKWKLCLSSKLGRALKLLLLEKARDCNNVTRTANRRAAVAELKIEVRIYIRMHNFSHPSSTCYCAAVSVCTHLSSLRFGSVIAARVQTSDFHLKEKKFKISILIVLGKAILQEKTHKSIFTQLN